MPGGKGANQAVACARAGGARTRMLLALGEDAFAPLIEQSLRQAGVELHVVRVAKEATGVALICLADDAENAITVAPGANSMLARVGPAGSRRRRLSAPAARNATCDGDWSWPAHGARAAASRWC